MQGECTELTVVIIPYLLYSTFQAILRVFKFFPEEFVSTIDAEGGLNSKEHHT